MPDADVGPAAATPTASSSVGSVVARFGRILAPIGVMTAILFYFGYVRQRAFYQYFGLDLGTLRFSTADFLVGSAQVAFLPLASALLAALLMVVAHHALMLGLRRGSAAWSKATVLTFAGLGLAMFAIAVAGLGDVAAFRSGYAALIPPIALCLGALLTAYSVYLGDRYLALPAEVREGLDTTRTLGLSILTAVLLVGAFWATATFAEYRGTVAARAIELSLPVEPQAVIYSKQRLYITGPGVHLAELESTNAAYSYRYTGLRLLVHANERWFLLPAGWSHVDGSTVIILPDTAADIRVDLAP